MQVVSLLPTLQAVCCGRSVPGTLVDFSRLQARIAELPLERKEQCGNMIPPRGRALNRRDKLDYMLAVQLIVLSILYKGANHRSQMRLALAAIALIFLRCV
jgi:hypothetical protein